MSWQGLATIVAAISTLMTATCIVAAYRPHHWPTWLDPFDRP